MRKLRTDSRAAVPFSSLAMSPLRDWHFAARPIAAMRRPRLHSVEPSIRWSSRAWVPSGSRPIRQRRAAGTKGRRSSGRGMHRSGSISSPNWCADVYSTGSAPRAGFGWRGLGRRPRQE